MWTLWGPGSRLLFWLGRLPPSRRAVCLPVLLHAARFTLNPGRNLSTNTTIPTIATRQLFIGASDPHAAHGQRGRFNCRAVPAAALAFILMHNGPAPPMLVLPLCFQTNRYKYLSGLCLCMCFPGTFPLLYLP